MTDIFSELSLGQGRSWRQDRGQRALRPHIALATYDTFAEATDSTEARRSQPRWSRTFAASHCAARADLPLRPVAPSTCPGGSSATTKRIACEADWQNRLAAEPLIDERFVKVLPGGRRRTEHGRPNTFSLGCRCAHCTYANTSYIRVLRQARRGDGEPIRRLTAPKGRPDIREPWLSPQWFGEVLWRPATDRAGLNWLHFHDLRQAHATWLLAAGVGVRSVQKRLGHKNLATSEIYLGELVDVEDVASFLGSYREVFAAARRVEVGDGAETAATGLSSA